MRNDRKPKPSIVRSSPNDLSGEAVVASEAAVADLERRAASDAASATEHTDHLREVIDDLRIQVELLEESTSWRITAPFRWISGIATGVRRGRSR